MANMSLEQIKMFDGVNKNQVPDEAQPEKLEKVSKSWLNENDFKFEKN